MKKLLLAIGLFSLSQTADAQVGIGTTTPNASSILELNTTTKGFLPPRMLSTERAGIGSPATGLLVYQTDAPAGLYYNTGTPAAPNWRMINSGMYAGVTVVLPTGATYNYTTPLSAVGGLVIFDFNNNGSNLTLNTTLPSPSAAGNGARIRFSYNRYNSAMNLTPNFTTPSGTIYPGSGTTATSIQGFATSEFISDGTNWREVPAL